MATLNKQAFALAEAVIKGLLDTALTDYGKGFLGSPDLQGGVLNGVNQWWFMIDGNAMYNQPLRATQQFYTGQAIVGGVFTSRVRAWEVVPIVHSILPVEKVGPVTNLYAGDSSPTNVLEYFSIHGREGHHGLNRVTVPLNIVIDYSYFPPEEP